MTNRIPILERELEELCRQQTNTEAAIKFYDAFMRIALAAYEKGYDDAKKKAYEFYEPCSTFY